MTETRKQNTKAYFAKKAALTRVNANLKAKHPDWTAKKIYTMAGSIVNGRKATAK